MNIIAFIENTLLRPDKKGIYNTVVKSNYIKKMYPEQYEEICKQTTYLNNPTFSQRIYHIINNLTAVPTCFTCKKPAPFIKFSKGYAKYCSAQCIDIKERQKTREATFIRKYGTTNPWANDKIKAKIKNTCIAKYGVENYSQSKESRERNKQNKIKYRENISWPRIQEILNAYNYTLITTPEEYSGVIEYKCDKGHLCKVSLSNLYKKQRCGKCFGKFSQIELEIREFLKHEYCIVNSKKIIPPHELDIYLPDHNLAIEVNGLFWHQENESGKNSSLHKLELCEQQNIKLIVLFEDEWIHKKDIVKSMINNFLNKNSTLYARKCTIQQVNNKQKTAFLEKNHIQSNCISSINLGLFYDTELVSLMTFGARSISRKATLEMLRFCNKINLNVVGAGSKLFRHFIDNFEHTEITSYCDKRWFSGKLYEKLGFELDHISKPNYWYFLLDEQKRYHRVKFQKHKLLKLLENFNSDLTEWENMKKNRFGRIWDCGNKVFKFKVK